MNAVPTCVKCGASTGAEFPLWPKTDHPFGSICAPCDTEEARDERRSHFVLCESMAEAEVVELEARRRVEMLRVHVNVGRPRQRAGTLYSWSGPDGWLRRAARSEEMCG